MDIIPYQKNEAAIRILHENGDDAEAMKKSLETVSAANGSDCSNGQKQAFMKASFGSGKTSELLLPLLVST